MADTARRRLAAAVVGTGSIGVLGLGYAGLIERNLFTLRHTDVPVLPAGAAGLRILHLSDLHVRASQRRKVSWIQRLATLQPDLLVVTGDFIGGDERAIDNTLRALGPLARFPGVYVWGNNDHYAPVPKSPTRYFTDTTRSSHGAPVDLTALRDGLTAMGWHELNNRRQTLSIGGRDIQLSGVDDPHTGRDRYDDIAGPCDPAAVLRIGVLHSPEPAVLNRFVDDGHDLLLAGHTHGGQVRIPFYGAVVTNCGIDRDRVRWLSTWTSPAGKSAALHVSAGLGTSPYSPVRFSCLPEATVLNLTAR